jgi:BASS family bile acid:Na+ symporter
MRVQTAALLLAASTAYGFAPSTVRAPVAHNAISAQPAAFALSGKSRSSVSMNMAKSSSAMQMSEAAADDGEKSMASKIFDIYTKTANAATTLFPLWTVLFTAIALKKPSTFDFFTTEYFTAALAALMLSMGITLTPQDFVAVASEPSSVLMQVSLCYGMMPALALFLGKAFGLEAGLLAGMVLVGSINGGQASNLCTYIAKGNVALSVLMTTATTVGAILMTPFLCKTILGAVVPVDAKGIAMSTIQVVLAPIAIGMTANKFFPKIVKNILPFAPVVGVVSTCLLVASAVAQVADPILNAGIGLQIPVLLLHLLGGIVGYWLPKATGFGEVKSRTMAIETSMKSSAFGFLLAKLHFGDYIARVPSAVSVVWMALTGSLLAVVWRYIPVKEDE